MPLQLLPLEEADYQHYWKISDFAFRDGGLHPVMFPDEISPAGYQHLSDGMKREETSHPGRYHRLKVIDTDLPASDPYNKIIGVSTWKLFPTHRSEQDFADEAAEAEAEAKTHGFPEGMNAEAAQAFFGELEEYRMKNLGGKPYVLLYMCATHPDHYRRGVAGLHLKWGLDKADELDLPAYLEASPKGAPLYRRFGFEDIEVLPFDARNWGLEDKVEHITMIRPKKSERGD